LRALYDAVRDTATRSYDAVAVQLRPESLADLLDGVRDRRLLADALTLFQRALADETESTARVGGAVAGARCSQMRILGAITKQIEERLRALG
jgi:hypothetical protein